MVHIGYKNMVSKAKIIAITTSDSSPLRRQRQKAEDIGKLIDCTNGKGTKSLIHMAGDYVILSSLEPATLVSRMQSE